MFDLSIYSKVDLGYKGALNIPDTQVRKDIQDIYLASEPPIRSPNELQEGFMKRGFSRDEAREYAIYIYDKAHETLERTFFQGLIGIINFIT